MVITTGLAAATMAVLKNSSVLFVAAGGAAAAMMVAINAAIEAAERRKRNRSEARLLLDYEDAALRDIGISRGDLMRIERTGVWPEQAA